MNGYYNITDLELVNEFLTITHGITPKIDNIDYAKCFMREDSFGLQSTCETIVPGKQFSVYSGPLTLGNPMKQTSESTTLGLAWMSESGIIKDMIYESSPYINVIYGEISAKDIMLPSGNIESGDRIQLVAKNSDESWKIVKTGEYLRTYLKFNDNIMQYVNIEYDLYPEDIDFEIFNGSSRFDRNKLITFVPVDFTFYENATNNLIYASIRDLANQNLSNIQNYELCRSDKSSFWLQPQSTNYRIKIREFTPEELIPDYKVEIHEDCSLNDIIQPDVLERIKGIKVFGKLGINDIETMQYDMLALKDIDLYNADCLELSSYPAYWGANIKSLLLPETMTEMSRFCVFCTKLEYVVLPPMLKSIYGDCFNDNRNLGTVVSMSKIPPTIYSDECFFSTDLSKIKLIVPKGTSELYKKAFKWSDFGSIEERELNGYSDLADIEYSGINLIQTNSDQDICCIYSLSGVKLYEGLLENRIKLPAGIYILIGHNTTKKLVIK